MKPVEIKEMPTVVDNRHESLFKSYHVLEQIRQMLERGDSKETVLEVIEFLYSK